ncbi:MAG: hypothetical protein ACK5Q5_04500 [Planctomycetaceae bacterium]
MGHIHQGARIERHAALDLRREAVASTPCIVEISPSVPGLNLRIIGRIGNWKLQSEFVASLPGAFETRATIAAAGAASIEVPIAGIVFAPVEAAP